MEGHVSREQYPWWVKLSLWGVSTRSMAWGFVLLSVLIAVACLVYGFWDHRFSIGVLLMFAALLYWLAIDWVDHHGK